MFLYVKAVEASDIPKMDVIGKSDPYLIFKLSTTSQEWQTSYKLNTHKPIWNESFMIPLTSNMRDELKVELFDKDDVSKDDFISSKTFDVKSLPVGQIIDEWYNFTPGKDVKKGGKVRLLFFVGGPNKKPFS